MRSARRHTTSPVRELIEPRDPVEPWCSRAPPAHAGAAQHQAVEDLLEGRCSMRERRLEAPFQDYPENHPLEPGQRHESGLRQGSYAVSRRLSRDTPTLPPLTWYC
jgi:hypothetical protein